MDGMLPWDIERQLVQRTSNARANYYKYLADQHDQHVASVLHQWGTLAPQIGRDITVPLAREGIGPDSVFGEAVIKKSPGLRPGQPGHAYGLAAPVQTPSVDELLAMRPDQGSNPISAGLGDIGGALGNAVTSTAGAVGHGLEQAAGAVGGVVQDALTRSQQFRQETLQHAGLPDVQPALKTPSRYITAGFQAGTEAFATGATYHAGLPTLLNPHQYTSPTKSPFDLQQFTLTQMIQGANSGTGFFPSGQAAQQAGEVQKEVRGTVGGHAATLGRVLAASIVEPGTQPYNIMSGLVDAADAWKLDPANVLLTKLGDVREARGVFDTYGLVGGHRNWLHGPTATQWLDSKAGGRLQQAVANTDSFRELWLGTGKKLPVQLVADLVDAKSPQAVRDLLLPVLGQEVRDVPKWGYGLQRTMADVRWANQMPRGTIDVEDVNHAVEQMNRVLVEAKVPGKTIDRILYKVAGATDRTQMFNAVVNDGGKAIATTLTDRYGIDGREARRLSSFFQDTLESDRQYFQDEMGNAPHMPSLTNDGEAVPITGPHIPSEMLNRAIPLPNPRELRKAASNWQRLRASGLIADHEVTSGAMSGLTSTGRGLHTLLDFMTENVFKVGALAKAGLPVKVISEEQVRSATAGLDSAFRHPLSYIAHVVGRKGNEDIFSVPFDQFEHGKFAEAMSGSQSFRGPAIGDGIDKIYAKHWVDYKPQDAEFARAWGDELSHLHIDSVANPVAKAMHEGKGLDAVKDSFWDGTLATERQRVVDGGGWRANLADRQWSDAYIDSVASRIQTTTANHPELLDAVANGGEMRRNMRLSKRFVTNLQDLADQGIAPESIKGRLAITAKNATGNRVLAGYNRGVDKMFTYLMAKPTNYLSRSPAFKQFYWQRVAETFPLLTEDAQKAALEAAQSSKIDKGLIAKMASTSNRGVATLDDLDMVAKAHALDSTKKLLYDVSQRSNFMDSARIVLPFGEAWKEVLSVWAKMAVDQPQVARRAQQIIQGARGAHLPGTPADRGFFYTDPNDGNEYFTFPFSEAITKQFTGLPFEQRGLVSGLNLVGQGLPGVGPALQIPLASLIPDKPQWDAVREAISPYGTPHDLTAFAPRWAQRFQTADWLSGVPGIGTALKPTAGFVAPRTPDQKRIFENSMKQVIGYLVTTGAYDTTKPEDMARLVIDAKNKAVGLYTLRGLSQFVAPTAPSYVPKVAAKDGKLYELWRMAKDYSDLYKKDPQTADQEFIGKYGQKAFLANTSMSKALVYQPPTTKQQARWSAENNKFVTAYPQVAGFFGPTSGDFDYNAYLRALDSGKRETLSPRDWLDAANHRLAASIYAGKRQMVGDHPSKGQQDWLRQWKQSLIKDYPGYDPEGSHGKNISPGKAMIQLQQAAADPAMKTSPFAQAVTKYFDIRTQALDAAKKAGFTTLASPSLEPLRAWLREWGTELGAKSPQFQAAWDQLLYKEVQIDTAGP